jgi:dolichol-phosphate mannosyltransferase
MLQSLVSPHAAGEDITRMNQAIGEHLSISNWDDCRITVVIPTYNEADNLPSISEALLRLEWPHLQLLIVDDNSPDGTGAVADKLAALYNAGLAAGERSRLVVMHRTGKGGLGTAYVAGMTRAIADGADYIVQMDADFSHSPRYLPQMLGTLLATGADVVIGSRYVPGGSLDEGWEWNRRLLSWWANLYSRAILGLRIRDMTAGFKMWRRSALEVIGLQDVRSNGYSFQVEMAYLCEKLGFRLVEIPIHFEDRRIGQSKLDIPVKLESAWRTWQIRWQYRHLRSPSRMQAASPVQAAGAAQTAGQAQATGPTQAAPTAQAPGTAAMQGRQVSADERR